MPTQLPPSGRPSCTTGRKLPSHGGICESTEHHPGARVWVCDDHDKLGRQQATYDLRYLSTSLRRFCLPLGRRTRACSSLGPEVHEKKQKERLVRQRALLRGVTALWLVDVLRTLDDDKPDDIACGAFLFPMSPP
ncbi:hypothetical protein PG984_006532 [Apiospora sp. TS-2023a]